MRAALWLVGFGVAALGCADRSTVRADGVPPVAEHVPPVAEHAPAGDPAPFTLLAAEVVGDSLRVQVAYSGGCGEHVWGLASAGPMLKSLPPKQPLRIVHTTPGDDCRARLVETHTFALHGWRGTPRGVTVLLLEDWNTPLPYEYD